MTLDLQITYDSLYRYAEGKGFAGHDPFDGLNSRLFAYSPFKFLAPGRLAWLQVVKRSPFDLHGVAMVPEQVNSKTLSLFALAELSRFRATSEDRHRQNAVGLIEKLLDKKIDGRTAEGQRWTAFGYNFDWQSRHFFLPEGSPAIVPTAFAARALIEGSKALGDERYLETAGEVCEFILGELNRPVETDDEVCFSYTPVDRSIIYNASLLAGETLAEVGSASGNEHYRRMAAKAVRFVTQMQHADGSWFYGSSEKARWVDSFHTAYVLQSIFRISAAMEELRPVTYDAIVRGAAYWLKNFFLDDGTPKYYNDRVHPIDIHSAAAAIAVMSELSRVDAAMLPMARKTAEWTIENMRDPRGYFYYQKRPNKVIKTSFMRWGQAWMAYGLAALIEAESKAAE